MSYLVNGITFEDKKFACFYYNLHYQSVLYKMKYQNKTLEEAINSLLLKKREFVIFGKKYTKLDDIANEYGIDRVRFYGYMNKYNKDKNDKIIEEYIKKQLKKEKKEIRAFGKRYERICDLERYFKLARNQLKGIEKEGQIKLENKLRQIMYKRYIINKNGDVNIVKVPDSDRIVFVLDDELDKLLLYRDYDNNFYEERKWEEVS